MILATAGLLGPGALPTGGLQPPAAAAPLLLTATLKAATIDPPAPASPFTIDRERTQEIVP